MSETFDEADWRDELLANRREKDEFFADHPQSPLPEAERDSFDGLSYYPPDPAFRVEATAEVAASPGTVPLERTAGDEVEYYRIATLRFDLEGAERTLAAYRQPGSATLFVPFRDATSGEETYGGGRYMEFDPEGELADGATVVVDFNLAYAPFCAYDDAYACVLPPAENHLDVAVTAGERGP